MKKTITFLILIGFVGFGKAQGTKAEDKVKQTIVEMFDALSERNIEKMKSYCTTDIQLLENGEVWNLDMLVNAVSKTKPEDFKRINRIEFINVDIQKDIAWTTYHNEAEITGNGKHFKIQWLETAILTKQNIQWKIKVLHSTVVNEQK